MSKRKKFIIFIVATIITLGLFYISVKCACKSDGLNTNPYTIISGWIGGFSTLIIGFLSLYLTNKIDKMSKQKDLLRDKELKQQYINTLKLNASPNIYFENIECLNLSQNGMIISNNESVNRLLDQESKKEIIPAVKSLSFDFIFKTPKAESVENIHINAVDFYIKKINGFANDYEHRFINYSSNNSANLKYTDSGCLACHTDLLYLQEDEELLDKLNNVIGKENMIVLIVKLTASNSLGLCKKYDCGFYFNITTKTNEKYGMTNYKIKMKDNVMWAKGVSVDSDIN